MGIQIKKKARSFSLTDEEMQSVLARAEHHGFKDRNEYLMALVEADEMLAMEIVLRPDKQKALRPSETPALTREINKMRGGGSQGFSKR